MENEPLKIFIGYDSSEPVAYHVCCDSIIQHANRPVSFTPIGLKNVPAEYTRPRGLKDSTDFAISRFLVPWLCNFQGLALFMDCDVIVQSDISTIFDRVDSNKAVNVVKHNYISKVEKKFLGQNQTKYSRKNWSSVMLFNNKLCSSLTMDYVMSAHGLDLHQFSWIDDKYIGTLSPEWNHLVGEYELAAEAKLLHYTLGGPYFPEYRDTDNADEWFRAFEKAIKPVLMDK